jgi:hypothetical protein
LTRNIPFPRSCVAPVSTASPKSAEEIKQARRRLSVMSDNKLVEGFETSVTLEEPEEVRVFAVGKAAVLAILAIYSLILLIPF